MAIMASAYGSTADVAVLTPRYAGTAGDFTTTTNPTKITVENLINQVSSIINGYMAAQGFVMPVTATALIVVESLKFFVTQEVALVVEGINGSGRFGPTNNNPGFVSPFGEIFRDVMKFVDGNSVGFERLGAIRLFSASSGVGYRDTDASGDVTFPLFQRDNYGPQGFNSDSDSPV